jgi:LysM repeat protein
VATARQSLVDANQLSQKSPTDLQTQLSNQQATVVASQSVFLTDSQVSQLTDDLYRYATAAGVTITDLQTQPLVPQNDQNAYNALSMKLTAEGDSHQLVLFASQIKETVLQGFVVNNINLTQGKTTSKLSLDVSVFSSNKSQAASVSNPVRVVEQAAPARVVAAVSTPRVVSAPVEQQPSLISAPTPVPQPATATLVPATATSVPPTATSPAPTATRVPPTPVPQAVVYVVRPGDTLFALARRYGTTIEAIMGANGLPNYQIRVGQQLVIPAH